MNTKYSKAPTEPAGKTADPYKFYRAINLLGRTQFAPTGLCGFAVPRTDEKTA
ncbi:MAG: hypothetical protein K1V97_09540 [Lachnospiraceae bacterium]